MELWIRNQYSIMIHTQNMSPQEAIGQLVQAARDSGIPNAEQLVMKVSAELPAVPP
jgi:hypothetical protein